VGEVGTTGTEFTAAYIIRSENPEIGQFPKVVNKV
jgi:hypothetical protein